MAHVHPLGSGLAAPEGVVHELLREEEHLVDAAVEQSAQPFAPFLFGRDDGLVVPDYDGFAEEAQGAQENHELQVFVVCGVYGVHLGVCLHHLPQYVEGRPEAAAVFLVAVHRHFDAVVLEMGGSIEKMTGESALLPFTIYILYVFGVIEIYSHSCKFTHFSFTTGCRRLTFIIIFCTRGVNRGARGRRIR